MENSFVFSVALLENLTLWLLIVFANGSNMQSKFSGHIFVVTLALATTVTNNYSIPYHFVFLITVMFLIVKLLTKNKWIFVISDVILANAVFLVYQLAISIAVRATIGDIFDHSFIMVLFLIVGIFLAILLNRSIRINNWLERYYRPNRSIILLALINIAVLCAFIVHIFDDRSFLFWESQTEFFMLTIVFVLANVLLMIITYKYAGRKKQLEQSHEYAEFLSGLTENLSAREHEHKNHIAAIIAMSIYVEEHPEDRIREYCKQLLEDNRYYKRTGVVTDNVNIAAFLKYKTEKAEECGIRLNCYIEKPYPHYNIPDYDMIELLANLINNAIEELEGVSEEHKSVYLMMDSESIRVKNRIAERIHITEVRKASNLGYSTKGQGRGYGLTNIKAICKHYQIRYQIRIENNNYITELIIPSKEPSAQ